MNAYWTRERKFTKGALSAKVAIYTQSGFSSN
jgi:hypothetical protein